MPQPYRGDGSSVYFAAQHMLQHPELPAHIAAISTLWTLIEDLWGSVLAGMLGFEAGAGVAIYNALVGTGVQRAVLNQIADEYLPDELRPDFQALMGLAKGRAKERNAVVHGLWFYDPALPARLILAPRYSVSSVVAADVRNVLINHLSAGTKNPKAVIDYSTWLIYRRTDFEAIFTRLVTFSEGIEAFKDKLRSARVGWPGISPAPPLRSEP